MYFADNYPWSLTVAMLFDEVATFGEIDDALADYAAETLGGEVNGVR